MIIHKWVGPRPEITSYKNKKDIPAEHRNNIIRIKFGLAASCYVVVKNNIIQGINKIPYVQFCLVTPGFVIGPRNAEAAKNYPWAHEWRETYHEWKGDQIKPGNFQ